jgi:hypothetical protein
MAYNRQKIEDEAVKVIKKEKLTFFTDLQIYLEPSLSTLYEWELEKSEEIKKALAVNRLSVKKKMRINWQDSDNPTLQVAAYKLLADDEELVKLTSNKHEISGDKGGPIKTENKHIVEFHDFTNGDQAGI